MKILRHFGSATFVLGLFVVIFIGIPWGVIVSDDPIAPWWLKAAIFCVLGGILVVLVTLVIEQKGINRSIKEVVEFYSRGGNANPIDDRAARTRMRLSRTPRSGRPTMSNPGRPSPSRTSTSTG